MTTYGNRDNGADLGDALAAEYAKAKGAEAAYVAPPVPQYSNKEILDMLREIYGGPKKTVTAAAAHFGVDRTTWSRGYGTARQGTKLDPRTSKLAKAIDDARAALRRSWDRERRAAQRRHRAAAKRAARAALERRAGRFVIEGKVRISSSKQNRKFDLTNRLSETTRAGILDALDGGDRDLAAMLLETEGLQQDHGIGADVEVLHVAELEWK